MQQFSHSVCCSNVPSGKALHPSVVKVFNSSEEHAVQKHKIVMVASIFNPFKGSLKSIMNLDAAMAQLLDLTCLTSVFTEKHIGYNNAGTNA